MSSESLPLQHDMFTGQLVDTRSAYRKQRDRERTDLWQPLLFPVKEVFSFGVNSRPWLNDLPAPPLALTAEDPRTPEELERDLLREANEHTFAMFDPEPHQTPEQRLAKPLPREIQQVGYRLRTRYAQVALRHRNVC